VESKAVLVISHYLCQKTEGAQNEEPAETLPQSARVPTKQGARNLVGSGAHASGFVPWFWPLSLSKTLTSARIDALRRNLTFAEVVQRTQVQRPAPTWSTSKLREYSRMADGPFTLVVPPYAGHSSTIADFRTGQSLIETVLAHGIGRLCAIDWKSANRVTKSYDIDKLSRRTQCVHRRPWRSSQPRGIVPGGMARGNVYGTFPSKSTYACSGRLSHRYGCGRNPIYTENSIQPSELMESPINRR